MTFDPATAPPLLRSFLGLGFVRVRNGARCWTREIEPREPFRVVRFIVSIESMGQQQLIPDVVEVSGRPLDGWASPELQPGSRLRVAIDWKGPGGWLVAVGAYGVWTRRPVPTFEGAPCVPGWPGGRLWWERGGRA